MNSAAVLFCQTVVAALWWSASLSGADSPSPEWQKELDTLRLSEATVALLPPGRADQADEARRRLDLLFRRLVARYPREAAVRKAAGEHYWREDHPAAAITEWEAARALDPADGDTASALGGARLREGLSRAACEEFQRAVAAQPEVARYHFELGNVLYLFRHQLTGLPDLPDEPAVLRESLTQLRAARDLAAGNVEYARAYAETFYGVPDPEWREALDAWDRVRVLSADAPDFALSHLARISLRLNKPDEAESYLGMMHDPRFAPAQATLRRQVAHWRRREADRGAAPP